MKKTYYFLGLLFTVLFIGIGNINNAFAQDKLVSVELPNGTTTISDEITDATSGYKLSYYNMKYQEVQSNKTYYQFNSGLGSYVKIEAPSGEHFQIGDIIIIDTYVNRSASDSRMVSIYDRVNYTSGGIVVGSKSVGGSVVTACSITLGSNLPENTNVLYMPATSSINAYVNIHGVEVYGERGKKAKLASLTVGGTANLNGYKVNYMVDAMASETTAAISYTKESDKDVTLAISDVQTIAVDTPSELTNWSNMPATVNIPATPGNTYYYYVRSSLADHETIYYELEITRRNTADVIYNYDLTVNPITSVEDPTLSNIVNTAGYHSSHGWRFNYASGSTFQVKVSGDAIIKLRGCMWNSQESKITATVSNTAAGNIVPASQVSPINDCAGYNNFYYAGEANTITFTYSGVAFLSYVTIINEGSGEADLRAVFAGEKEISLADFQNGEYTLANMGYVATPSATDAFSNLALAMKKGLTAPNVSGSLNSNECIYTYSFTFNGTDYKIHLPYEREIGYTENAAEQRYDITTSFGLRTVVDMINKGTSAYPTIYLPNGTYDLGDTDGSYQHGISLTAANVIMIGESRQARITGKYYGVTSSVVEVKGANTIIRNLTIENLVGDNGVAPALSTGGDNIFFDNVQIIGWQDTYVGGGGKHLFNECTIAGSVDFICNGDAVDYFLRCELQLQYRKNGGYITAPQGQSYFRDCRVTNVSANATTMSGNFALARPWRETGKAFFINTTFDIVANLGFTGMSGNIFPLGSSGSVGNLKEADGTLLSFNNAAEIPAYTMTEANIISYSSVYNMCGTTLAALISEPVIIPANQYTTLYAADALIVPSGITAYAVESINDDYIQLGEMYAAGETIPACTPVVLTAEVNEETVFRFMYAPNNVSGLFSGTNLLSGSLVHKTLSDNSVKYYTLGSDNGVAAFLQQGNSLQIDANSAYLTLSNETINVLPLTANPTSITIPNIDKTTDDGYLYDLQGRRVFDPQKGQIYIVNGNKVLYLK